MDIIRQKIMVSAILLTHGWELTKGQCDGDIDLIVYTDPGREGRQPIARFDIVHMCRNFEDIQQWTLDHAWDR